MKLRNLAAAVGALALLAVGTSLALAVSAADAIPATVIDPSSIVVSVPLPPVFCDDVDVCTGEYTSLAAAGIKANDVVTVSLTATPAALAKYGSIKVFLADYWPPEPAWPPTPVYSPTPVRSLANLATAVLTSTSPTTTLSIRFWPPVPYLPVQPNYPPQPVAPQLVLGVGTPLTALTSGSNYSTQKVNRVVQQVSVPLA